MKVFDIMSDHIVTVGLREPVSAAARLLKQYNIGAVPVCDDRGSLRGMITDRDIAVRRSPSSADDYATETYPIMRVRVCLCVRVHAYGISSHRDRAHRISR